MILHTAPRPWEMAVLKTKPSGWWFQPTHLKNDGVLVFVGLRQGTFSFVVCLRSSVCLKDPHWKVVFSRCIVPIAILAGSISVTSLEIWSALRQWLSLSFRHGWLGFTQCWLMKRVPGTIWYLICVYFWLVCPGAEVSQLENLRFLIFTCDLGPN